MEKLSKINSSTWSTDTLDVKKSSLLELFTGSIKEIYWAENHLLRTLQKMKHASTSTALQDALDDHLNVTKEHTSRLWNIFGLLDEKIDSRECKVMGGLARCVDETIEYSDEGTAVRDLGLILAWQKIKNYEIATYTGLLKLAMIIGRDDIAVLLSENLEEENQCNEDFTPIMEVIAHNAIKEG